MNYILQVFAGPWHSSLYTPEAIIRKIGRIASRLPVTGVIIGWRTDPSLYREVGLLPQQLADRLSTMIKETDENNHV